MLINQTVRYKLWISARFTKKLHNHGKQKTSNMHFVMLCIKHHEDASTVQGHGHNSHTHGLLLEDFLHEIYHLEQAAASIVWNVKVVCY